MMGLNKMNFEIETIKPADFKRIYKHIKKGKIHAIKVGNKYRVPISQFKI